MIGKSLLLLQIVCSCLASQDASSDPVTYEQLYGDGEDAYWNESWSDSITHLRGAVDKYNLEMKAREECYAECRDHQPSTLPPDYADDSEETKFLHASLQHATCVQQCKLEVAGTMSSTRRGVSSKIEAKMAIRYPYSYLQFALYKTDKISSAASAAATYQHFNPLDSDTVSNMAIYRKQDSVTKDDLLPMETGQEYRHLYAEGVKLYNQGKYVETLDKFEKSLKALLPAIDKCRLLCAGPLKYTDNLEYSAAMSYLFKSLLECRMNCAQKLGEFRGGEESDTNFLASYFNYLQYGYHWDKQLLKAVKAVTTHRRIDPNSEVARMNAVYYQQLPGITKKDHKLREDVLPLIKQLEEDKQLLKIVKEASGDISETVTEEKEDDLDLLMKDGQKHPIEQATPTSNKTKQEKEKQKEGNRIGRMVKDGLVSSKHCEELMDLAKLGNEGDGYAKKSPHTPHEKFEGLSILGAAQAVVDKRTTAAAARLYMNVSTRVKDAIAAHFNLQRPLYFSYTHLVCRTALDTDSQQHKDLSHPVHADNCVLDEVKGECNKVSPAYTWRDYSAILYINEEFEGGKFFFAHSTKKLTPQEYVQPTCGRMVGFSAGKENMHGVTAVTKGRRCAVALWFTMDPAHKEEAYTEAEIIMNSSLVSQ